MWTYYVCRQMLRGLEGFICGNSAHLGAAEAGDNNWGVVSSNVLRAYREKCINVLLVSLKIYEKRPSPTPPFCG